MNSTEQGQGQGPRLSAGLTVAIAIGVFVAAWDLFENDSFAMTAVVAVVGVIVWAALRTRYEYVPPSDEAAASEGSSDGHTEIPPREPAHLVKRWRALPRGARRAASAGLAVLLATGGFLWWQADERREAERREARVAALVDALTPVEVVYEVEGDGRWFEMTATTPTGIEQSSPDLPLRTKSGGKFTRKFSPGSFVSISAQASDGRRITCRISAGGRVISENTSNGEYAIASCSGRV